MNRSAYLCIHGHFYQPPRENPWIEAIEEQSSAHPYHDWNERIFYESYLSNAMARVLEDQGRIVDIVNNFEKISFNFGPSLMWWMQDKHPETHQMIVEADQKSRQVFGGHGNAIAQVYNHMIMPLANRLDKITQVVWGIEDFKFRFGREPEAIWLAETACNEETLEVLVEAGMKFLILEPHQAEAIRRLDSQEWLDMPDGRIDPKRPYRCFLKKDPAKYIDIFFYDGPISKAASFEDLLTDAKFFMSRLEGARDERQSPEQLIHIATDGETYGHHKKFGDRALAYLLQVEAPARNFEIINYGQYLEKHPPRYEVRLKDGEDGEGTSWSCAHGVKRWKEHCGCRGDGPAEWHQHWRKPLREALDWLRDEVSTIFEQTGEKYFHNIWKARDEYIQVILNRDEQNVWDFINRNQSRNITREDAVTCLKLFEIQRHAMLMYTSCGWFFTELSGIETVQILQYAGRVIELASEFTTLPLEEEFLKRLALAKSNIPDLKDGRGVYERFVKPNIFKIENIASVYAMASALDGYYTNSKSVDIYSYHIDVLYQRKENYRNLALNFGRIRVTSKITWETEDLIFVAAQIGLYDFRCSIRAFHNPEEFEDLEKEFFEELNTPHMVEFLRRLDLYFGNHYYALKDLPLKERKEIISVLAKETIEKIENIHENLYDENRGLNEIYRSVNLPIPSEIRYAAEHTLSKRLLAAMKEISAYQYNLRKARPIYRIIDAAKSFGVELEKNEIAGFLEHDLNGKVRELQGGFDFLHVQICIAILRLSRKIGIDLDLRKAQDYLFYFLKKKNIAVSFTEEIVNALVEFATLLGINSEAFQSKIKHKAKG